MRLLHVDLGDQMRGGQRQALLLMQGLRAAGHECELLAHSGSALWKAAQADGFVVERARWKTLRARSQRVDLTHVHDARAHTLAALAYSNFVAARRVAFPIAGTWASRWKYSRARRFFAVSAFVASQLEQAGVSRDRIDIVYDGVEVSANSIAEPGRGTFALVALDSRDPQKGRDLVEAASVIANIPVRFSKDLAKDLPNASAFLYITRSEGLGSAALLALSLGVPVIASKVGGLPEVVQDGVSGLLVENDPHLLAAAMLRLRAESGLAERLGQNGRESVLRRFTAGHMVKNTLAGYARALAAE